MEEKEFEYKEEYAWLTNICLNVTDACNLACRYCFVEQHPHYMTLDVAKQAVHFILDNLEKKNKKFGTNERGNITYFGGEPTLMWDEILVPLTNYVKENEYPIDFSITTNGTLLNEDRIQFLKDNKIYPLLSIDGNKYTQDYNRPCHNHKSSFDLVQKNIPYILEAFPLTTFRSTVYCETSDQVFNNYIFAIQSGFKNIFLCPDSRTSWTDDQKKNLHIEVNKIFTFLDYCFSNNFDPIRFSLVDDLFKEMLKHDLRIVNNIQVNNNIIRSPQRCGLGTTSGSIGYDGSIYACQEQDSKQKNLFYIGHLNENGINQHLHNSILKNYCERRRRKNINPLICDNCLLQNNCQDFGCPSLSFDLYNDFFIETEINCLWRQWIFQNCIQLNNKMVQENNLLFKKYIENLFKGVKSV